jgi:hypothetical protein
VGEVLETVACDFWNNLHNSMVGSWNMFQSVHLGPAKGKVRFARKEKKKSWCMVCSEVAIFSCANKSFLNCKTEDCRSELVQMLLVGTLLVQSPILVHMPRILMHKRKQWSKS